MITCKDLAIGYDNRPVQKNINLTLEEGSYICVLGENGAGKSTLIKTILGLIPPLDGEVKLTDELKDGIGYLPQQSSIQKSFPSTVREVIMSGRQNRIKFFYKKEDVKTINETASKLQIEDLMDKSYAELSGGQQQRVLLARALCVTDRLLILDEPITGLDISNQTLFYELVEKLNRNGTTIIMVSHDRNVLDNNATHVLSVTAEGTKLYRAEEYKRG